MLSWLGGDDLRPAFEVEKLENVLGFEATGFNQLECFGGDGDHSDLIRMSRIARWERVKKRIIFVLQGERLLDG